MAGAEHAVERPAGDDEFGGATRPAAPVDQRVDRLSAMPAKLRPPLNFAASEPK